MLFRSAGYDETINGLSGNGTIDNLTNANSTNTLTVGDGNADALIFSGAISNTTGEISLLKTGSGIQTLSGLNSYGGTTTVSGGTLLINGNQSGAAGAVQVNSGTLGGTGTIGGAVTIAAAGTIAPGAVGSIESLDVAATTTITGTFACDIDGATTDQLAITGDLVLTGSTLSVNPINPGTAGSYVIATYTGSRTGVLGGTLPAGYSVNYDDANKEVELVVPAGSGYTTWATTNSVLEGENGDDDDDGVINLVEYALGLNPQVGNPAPGTFTGNTLTYIKGTEANAADDVTYTIETSTSLQTGSWANAVVAAPEDSSISFTLPSNQPGGKLFGRLKVTKP